MTRLTYANVMATIAIFVALGGASYAALSLPANSVGTRQLKRGSVTPSKLARTTLKKLAGRPGPAGLPGATGAKGDTGPTGAAGADGSARAYGVFTPSALDTRYASKNIQGIRAVSGTAKYCVQFTGAVTIGDNDWAMVTANDPGGWVATVNRSEFAAIPQTDPCAANELYVSTFRIDPTGGYLAEAHSFKLLLP